MEMEKTMKALWDLLFGGGGRALKSAELKYLQETSLIWFFFFAVILGGPLLAHFELRVGIWILMFAFLVTFLVCAMRPKLSLGVLGAGAAVGVPAPETWQHGAAKAFMIYTKIVGLTLIWGEFYLLILLAFPFLASTMSAVATTTASLIVIMIVTVYGLVTGKIPEGDWHKPVLLVATLILFFGVYLAIPKPYLARYGLPTVASPATESEKVAIEMLDADQAILSARQQRQLEGVNQIRECKLSAVQIEKMRPEQKTLYNNACKEEPHRLTLKELEDGFPVAFKVWKESYGGGYLKKGKIELSGGKNDAMVVGGVVVGGHILYLLIAALLGLGGGGFYFWRKKAVTATTTTTSAPGFFSRNKGIIAIIALLVIGYYSKNSWVPYIQKVVEGSSQIAHEETGSFPNEFAKPSAFFHKDAYVTSPRSHPLYGKALPVRVGEHAGRNPVTNFVDWLNGGFDNKLVILSDLGDYRLDQSVCNKPQVYTDRKVYVTCIGSWKMGTATSGVYQAIYGEGELRELTLESTNSERVILEVR